MRQRIEPSKMTLQLDQAKTKHPKMCNLKTPTLMIYSPTFYSSNKKLKKLKKMLFQKYLTYVYFLLDSMAH